MIFKTHKENIPQIEAILESFGICYFHGDGNMYADKEASDFRKDFSNPKSDETAYRVIFKLGQKIPQTVEDLNKALLEARNGEIMAGMAPTNNSGQKTVTVKKKEGEEGAKLQVKASEVVPVSYGKMLKADLVKLATEREINIPDGSTVSDIIVLLEAKDSAEKA